MDDNVMRRYADKSTEAAHYVQYDQGAFVIYRPLFCFDYVCCVGLIQERIVG